MRRARPHLPREAVFKSDMAALSKRQGMTTVYVEYTCISVLGIACKQSIGACRAYLTAS
jgi:hypothetical protein